jgi:isopenicillin N synthase-like dioxygenase
MIVPIVSTARVLYGVRSGMVGRPGTIEMDILDLKEQQRGAATARQPAKTVDADAIPTIDVSGVLPGAAPAALARVADQIGAACETIGFFYAVNHGVPQSTADGAFAAARRFFDQPLETRLKIKLNDRHRGYLPLYNTTIPNYKANRLEAFELADELAPDDPDVVAGKPLHASNVWPELPGFRPAVERYYAETCGFGFHLLKAFAVALGMPADFFQNLYRTKPLASMRLLHYPAVPAGDDEFGAAPHSDYGIITILRQDDVGGLELYTRSGQWIAAPFVPSSFVINIGDLMALWTNDRFTSMQHRVVNRSGRSRFSIPIFYNPTYDTEVRCLPTCQSPDAPAKYAPKVMGDYLMSNFDKVWAYRNKAGSTPPS